MLSPNNLLCWKFATVSPNSVENLEFISVTAFCSCKVLQQVMTAAPIHGSFIQIFLRSAGKQNTAKYMAKLS